MWDHWVVEAILKKQRGEDRPQPQLEAPSPEPPAGWVEPAPAEDDEERGVAVIPMF